MMPPRARGSRAVLLLCLTGCHAPPAAQAPQKWSPPPAASPTPPAAGAARPQRLVLADTPDLPGPAGLAGPAGTDAYGDPLPPGAYARLGTVRLRHPGEPHMVRFSPDGKVLASLTYEGDHRVRLWRVPGGAPLGVLETGEQEPSALAFSPDGRRLATAGGGGAVHLWDVAGRAELRRLEGHKGTVRALAFSPDGAFLGSAGRDGIVVLWDPEKGTELRRFTDPGNELRALAISTRGALLSGKGPLLAYAGSSAHVALRDLASGAVLTMFLPQKHYVMGLALSPDGRHLAVAEDYPTLRDLRHFNDITRLGTEGELVTSVAFSPDGKLLASVSMGANDVRVWDVSGHRPRPYGQPPGFGCALDFSPDGRLLATANKVAIHLWDVAARKPLGPVPLDGEVQGVALSPDGGLVATASADGSAALWDPASGRLLHHLVRPLNEWGHPLYISSVAFGAGGKEVLGGGSVAGPQRWSREGAVLPGDAMPSATQWAVAASADGLLEVAADDEGHARLNPPSGPGSECLSWEPHSIGTLSVSPDRRRVAAGGYNGAWVCDLDAGGRVVLDPDAHVSAVALSRDGATVAVAVESEVRLHAAATGALRLTLLLPRPVTALAYAPDRDLLLIGGEDGTIRLWRPGAARLAGALPGHIAAVRRLALTPDGRTLASAREDATVLLFRLGPVR